LKCDLTVFYLGFPPFKCLLPGHSPNSFSAPVHCRLACWIPVSYHNFLILCLCCSGRSRPDGPQFRYEIVVILSRQPRCRSYSGCQIARCFINFYTWINFSSRGYWVRGKALKPLPACEFSNFTSLNMIQNANTVGRWSESKMSSMLASDSRTSLWTTMDRTSLLSSRTK
jgi:hypothetical protein